MSFTLPERKPGPFLKFLDAQSGPDFIRYRHYLDAHLRNCGRHGRPAYDLPDLVGVYRALMELERLVQAAAKNAQEEEARLCLSELLLQLQVARQDSDLDAVLTRAGDAWGDDPKHP